MKQNPTIQKFIAFFLLLIFAIGSAPKAYFHDLVADHKDLPGCHEDHQTSVLHKLETDCQFDDLVVSTPFVFGTQPSLPFVNFYFQKKLAAFFSSYFEPLLQHNENRGPPSA